MIILDKGDSQIVLYAKHHFARGEPLDDIRQLIAARAGIFYDAPISDLDIIIVLTGIVEELQIEHKMAEVPYMSEVVFGSRFGTNHEKRSAIERFVRATLHLFAGVVVRNGDEVFVKLAPPDFSILPPRDPAKVSQP